MNLYLIVKHRQAPEQTHRNSWGLQGKLVSITTTEGVLAAAELAKTNGTRVFIYETQCPSRRPSHISQEVTIATVNRDKKTVSFDLVELLYRKPPFRASQATPHKLDERLPTEPAV